MLGGRISDSLREQLEGGVSEVAVVNAKGYKFGFRRFRRCQWRFEVEFDAGCGCRRIGGACRAKWRNGSKRSGNIFYCMFIGVVFEISRNAMSLLWRDRLERRSVELTKRVGIFGVPRCSTRA